MRAFRWVIVVFATVTFAFFLLLYTQVLGPAATVAVDDYLCTIAPITSGVLCLRRSRRETGRVRLGWTMLGCAAVAWGLGGLTWTVYEVHLGVELPFPSWADVGYLGSVPLTVAGLVLLSGLRPSWQGGLRDVLDGALVATSVLFVSWATALGAVVEGSSGPLLHRAIALAYPVSDVLLATLAILAVARARGRTRVVMSLLGTGYAVGAVSDSSFAWFVAQNAYETGNLFEAGYVAGYLITGAAALYPTDEHTVETDETIGMLGMVLPFLPGVGVAVVLVGMELTGRPLHGVLFWNGLAIVLLVFARHVLGIRANLRLQRRLQDSLSALRERESRLEHQVHHDGLTGLPNRTLFAAESARMLDGSTPCALLVIDLDGFKDVNDTHGHHVGDELLIAVAGRLTASARQSDCVARLGGDEFAMILADIDSSADTDALVDRIARVLNQPVRLTERTVHVRASIGVAHSDDGPDVDTLLRIADGAMYRAKRNGRNRHAELPRPRSPSSTGS